MRLGRYPIQSIGLRGARAGCLLVRRPVVIRAFGAALLVSLFLLPVAGGAGAPPSGPPLSSIALAARFAREQGIVGNEFPNTAAAAQPATGGERVPRAGAGLPTSDVRVNQDYSLQPQNETTIAVNPSAPNMIVAGANDYRLGAPIGAAFYTSSDGGLTWKDGIPPYPLLVATRGDHTKLAEVPSGTGDPVVAFGKARVSRQGPRPGSSVAYYAYLGVSSAFCEHGIFVSRSSDGLLWTRPVVPDVLPPQGLFTPVYWDRPEDCNVFNDKPWLAVDNSGGRHDGRLYVTWSRFVFDHNRYQESAILLEFSDDNGETWSAPIDVSGTSRALCRAQISGPAGRCDEDQFSSVVIAGDGSVHVAFLNQQFLGARDGFRDQYLVTRVDPDSLTVTGPYLAAHMFDGEYDFPVDSLGQSTLCNSNFRLNSAGNLAADRSDPTGKTLYLVFADNRNGSGFPAHTPVTQSPPDSFLCPSGLQTDDDVFIVKSVDGGTNWMSPTSGAVGPERVNQDQPGRGRDQWFPFVAVGPKGRVDVMFYDRRDDPFDRFARVYLARSTDGGATWTEMQASSAPSNMNWAFEGGEFIGDYNGLAIGMDGTSYPFWTDTRAANSRVRQSDVWMGKVPP